MEEFLKSLVAKIIEKNFDVIKQEEGENFNVYKLIVPKSDFGKIIGKGGKTINSLTKLANFYLYKSSPFTPSRVILKVEEKI